MRKLLFSFVLMGQFLLAGPLQAQDVPCPTALNVYFNDYQPVVHNGASFFSEWLSERRSPSDYPLPSYNWYRAVPRTTLVSEDRGLRWYDARIKVHCWVELGYMGMRIYHYHPVETSGRTEIIQCIPDGSGPVDNYQDGAYDPYGGGDCTESGGGGDQATGCTEELVIIERNDGYGWYEIWRGYVLVCS